MVKNVYCEVEGIKKKLACQVPGFIARKRHYDHGSAYKGKHLI